MHANLVNPAYQGVLLRQGWLHLLLGIARVELSRLGHSQVGYVTQTLSALDKKMPLRQIDFEMPLHRGR